MVSHQGGHSSGWSLIRVTTHQGGISPEWPLIRNFLSPEWSLIRVFSTRVVSHQSFFSLTRVVSHQGFFPTRMVFHQVSFSLTRMISHPGGLSSGWSFIKVAYLHGFNCTTVHSTHIPCHSMLSLSQFFFRLQYVILMNLHSSRWLLRGYCHHHCWHLTISGQIVRAKAKCLLCEDYTQL